MATLSEEPDAGWEGGFVFALREVFDHDGNVAAWLMFGTVTGEEKGLA